ncbi:AIM24 family protein [Salinarchaeum chitinilyticum]
MNADEFTTAYEPTDSDAPFRRENSYALAVDVDGTTMAKADSMVAYTGDLTFTGKASVEGGVTGYLKDAVTGEGTPIMQIEGQGTAYLADTGKKIQVLELEADDRITVNGEDILAFESDLHYEITTIDSLSGALAGGLTNVELEGPGLVALTTHCDPVVLEPPVRTDPKATVAWTTAESPSVGTNKKLEIGQTSGEAIQMDFGGQDGFVLVQPYEEHGGA